MLLLGTTCDLAPRRAPDLTFTTMWGWVHPEPIPRTRRWAQVVFASRGPISSYSPTLVPRILGTKTHRLRTIRPSIFWFLTLDPPSFWYSFNFLTDQHSWWTSVSSVEAGAFECVCPSFVWKLYNSKNGSKSQSWSTFSVSPFQILTVAIFTLFPP